MAERRRLASNVGVSTLAAAEKVATSVLAVVRTVPPGRLSETQFVEVPQFESASPVLFAQVPLAACKRAVVISSRKSTTTARPLPDPEIFRENRALITMGRVGVIPVTCKHILNQGEGGSAVKVQGFWSGSLVEKRAP